jgi:hypothetical protein
MSSRRIQSDGSSVSLFPFLAVLLCTMGSLIVILVVLTKQVRATVEMPKAPVAVVDDGTAKKVAEESENLQWQIETLEQSLTTTAEQLQNDRLKLSNVEDAISRLSEKIAQLDLAAKELEKSSAITVEQRQSAEADLARMQHRVTDLASELQRAQIEAANRPQSYSIIPYEGPNQTHRQPIFIECTADAVIIQPEGIRLGADDFEEPLGPGNPLAAALRASREYMVRARRAANLPEQEPYPLIVVRPSGIAAYYGVRDAIKTWDSDFGYELIGEDWKLAYPVPDPLLREVQENAVEEGRHYQTRLASAAPSKYGRRTAVYRAAPHRGGLIREGGTGGSGGAMDGERGVPASSRGNSFTRMANNPQGPTGDKPSQQGHEGQESQPKGGNGQGTNHTAGSPAGGGQPAEGGSVGGSAGVIAPPPGSQASAGFGTPQQKPNGFENNGLNRRKNWALPDSTQQSVPIARTVRVLCRNDRFVIMPEKGLEGGYAIMLKANTQESIDEFVSKMWEHMKGWGIAGNGLYWRPVLVLQVLDGGDQRAHELALLLEGSGVEVRDVSQP